jgi:hypothetical protein
MGTNGFGSRNGSNEAKIIQPSSSPLFSSSFDEKFNQGFFKNGFDTNVLLNRFFNPEAFPQIKLNSLLW